MKKDRKMESDIGIGIAPTKKAKNLLRGLLDRKIQEDRPGVFPSVISKIYKSKDTEAIRWSDFQLRYNNQYSHVQIPRDFPHSPDPFRETILLKMTNPTVRARTIVDRGNRNASKVVRSFKKLKDINRAIADHNHTQILANMTEYLDEFGFSHILLRKAAFIASTTNEKDRSEEFKSLIDRLEFSKRDVIRPSLLDAYNRKRQYLGVVSNIMNISGQSERSSFRKAISKFTVRPICYSEREFSETLEAFSNYSLVDALHFLSLHIETQTDLNIWPELSRIWSDLDDEVRDVMFCDLVNQETLQPFYADTDEEGEKTDISSYRHLSAFLECQSHVKLRAVGDFYFAYKPETSSEPSFVGMLREERYGQAISWQGLTCKETTKGTLLVGQASGSLSTLERTLAMAIFFARQPLPESTGADEILCLMNETTFADRVISKRVLNQLYDQARASGDQLFQIIPLCLLAVDPQNTRDEFRLRRVLQDYVRENFASDYVSFIDDVHEQAPQVGIYLYQVSTDEFLLQFYHLFDESSQAVECRAKLHELMYKHYGDRRFQDLADSLRLSAKISKAREELDDSRIYVDLTRFGNWLKDHQLERMLTLIRSGALQKDTLESLNISTINSSQGNESEFMKILGECYREFCENRIFGIASFLGRRIRHGTLRGTLLQDFERSVDERFPQFFRTEPCREYFDQWKDDFERYIKKIGSDYFHIRSQQKTKGMINPEITEGRKFGYLKAGANSILDAFEDYEDPEYFIRIISETCWQIATTDLQNAQQVIASCKATRRIVSIPEPAKAGLGPNHVEFIKHMNAKLDEKFGLIASWFNRPRITVPSVDLPTLLRVVQSEVSEEFNSYEGATTDESQTRIELTGSSYHIVYDFLFVTLKNAAEHGKPGGNVSIDVSAAFQDAMVTQLVLKISSEYKEQEDASTVNEQVNLCRLDALDLAYVEEGKSGLRKIKRLERDWNEVSEVSIDAAEDGFHVTMTLDLIR
ncbi:hypothetical protein [Sulfitobacter donghicola]|uniref:hypothetical protein n=1 Tax=Sulfitobacter donghicola TaxID=421000 RepID=UPI0012DC1FB7|nr:hypothetical protein [Sulfitobacter donghicola]